MTKLRAAEHSSKIRPELVKQIHDKVIALCQKKYSSFEVDGLICITLLDSKEQQVVKIHKTLTSVTADKKKNASQKNTKSTAYPSIAAMLVSDGESANNSDALVDFERDVSSEEKRGSDGQVYQNAIDRLNSLLKETNELSNEGSSDNVDSYTQKSKKGKRKNKQPQQILQGASSKNINNKAGEIRYDNGKDYDKYTDSVIIVKEEPIDHGFDMAESVQQTEKTPDNNLVTPSRGLSEVDNNPLDTTTESRNDDQRESPDQVDVINQNEASHVSDEDNDTDTDKQVDKDKQSGTSNDSSNLDMPVPVSTYISAVIDNTIKSLENNVNESANKKHSEWLYSLAQRSLLDSGSDSMSLAQRALIDTGDSSRLNTISTPGWTSKYGKWNKRKDPLERERGQQEPDPLGRSWFEMIQSNASKYQAALLRSEGKGTTVSREAQPTPVANTCTNFDQLRDLLQKRQKDKGQDETIDAEDNVSGQAEETEEQNDSSKEVLDSDNSRSISPAPVVKIEVDEEAAVYSENNSGDFGSTNETAELPQTPVQKPSGKLESRYPALFNQLQQTRREVTPNLEKDSLLNRLPFISFQEIFSQPGSSDSNKTPKGNTSSGALVNLLNSPPNSGTKKVWNWKKRVVRPKDKHGNIISHLPPGAQIPREINSRKTFPKKRSKGDENEDEDTDWTPSSDKKVKLSKPKVKAVEEPQVGGHCTRLSSGEKPRIDFTEIEEVSEPEDDDNDFMNNDDYDDNADNFELISAFCRYQCGLRFETFGELAEHESVCEAKDLDVGNQVETEEDGLEEHKCDICGLEFNQEYRWQYHMVKVHGITVSTDPLFR